MKLTTSRRKKSIFRSIFIPTLMIMILQVASFYCVAVYGGVKSSLDQNAADILDEQLINQKSETENLFNSRWSNLTSVHQQLEKLYEEFEKDYGDKPLCSSQDLRTEYISQSVDLLVPALRQNNTNGIFVIVNDKERNTSFSGTEKKSGICIRDLDQTSNYTDREDLLLERGPSVVVNNAGIALDSWWGPNYTFSSQNEGDYFYKAISAAYTNPGADSDDIAYISPVHSISGTDTKVISYSIPLLDDEGYPYAVLGIELSTKYISSILPNTDTNKTVSSSCYLMAMNKKDTNEYIPVASSGVMFARCFNSGEAFTITHDSELGGFEITGRDGTDLYGDKVVLQTYNNNNPYEDNQLVIITMTDKSVLFSYSRQIQSTLLWVALVSLFIGFVGILIISRGFAKPITALANSAKSMKPTAGFKLERLGISEIDQLVDNIETLSRDATENIARTEFFARMSHDMRTPMNAIISFSSDELLENANDEQKSAYLKQIHNSGSYLLGLINEVLDMTKIESNKTQLRINSEKCSEILDTSIDIINKLAQKKDVNFVKEIHIDDDICILADKQHFNQVVMNLLSNAVKFTSENGTVKLVADFRRESEKNDMAHCHIIVSDTGIGMSEEFMKKLYTPFEQENSGKEGTGLGLSIARKLVELMGGTIVCSSVKGKGTTFDVNIDFRIGETVAPVETEPVQEEICDDAVLKGKRVLMCEDHPINAQIAMKLLMRKEMIVELAENGKIGVDKFSASDVGSFDVVLMDIRMPEMNGLEAAKAIRGLDRKDASEVPIIALTANAFVEDAQASAESGMNAHLSKPIEPDKLYATLTRLLS